MAHVKSGGESDFAGLGALNELAYGGISPEKSKYRKIGPLREHQGISYGGKVQLDVRLHGELEFASLEARSALLLPKQK